MSRNYIRVIFLLTLVLLSACQKSEDAEVLMTVDREFSDMSLESGMQKAFLAYAADSAVLLQPNTMPIVGKGNMEALYNAFSDTGFVLTWEPVFAKMAASADLGYTYGVFTLLNKASKQESQGTYVSIWGKQEDGTWKFLLDTGNEGL